jgi:hypothetical protein
MIRIRACLIAAAILVGVAAPAFADKPADKPAKEMVSDADAQRFLAFFEKLVAIVVANQNDCAKLAAAIDAHVAANEALVKQLALAREQNKQLPPVIKAKIEKRIRDEFQPALQKCLQDKAVKSALERMDHPKLDRPRRVPTDKERD